jgi:hypothetical protein
VTFLVWVYRLQLHFEASLPFCRSVFPSLISAVLERPSLARYLLPFSASFQSKTSALSSESSRSGSRWKSTECCRMCFASFGLMHGCGLLWSLCWFGWGSQVRLASPVRSVTDQWLTSRLSIKSGPSKRLISFSSDGLRRFWKVKELRSYFEKVPKDDNTMRVSFHCCSRLINLIDLKVK